MPLALSTGHEIGLALVAGAFIVFALLSALVIPRWWPQFPGRHLGWFIVGTIVLFVATLAAIETLAAEPKESAAGTQPERPGMTTQTTKPQPPSALKGDATAGKALFSQHGCSACHTFKAAGATGTIGPNLDHLARDATQARRGSLAQYTRESIVSPNAYIVPGYQPGIMPQNFGQLLTPAQVDDLVAFLLKK